MTPYCSSTMAPHCLSHMTPDRTLPIGISHLLVPFQRFQSRLQVRVYIVWLQVYIHIYSNGRCGYYYFCVWKDTPSFWGQLPFAVYMCVIVHVCVIVLVCVIVHMQRTWQVKASRWSIVSPALCTGSMSTRRCGLHFWGRSSLLPQNPRTTTTGMLCVWRRMERSLATYQASNVLFSTAVISMQLFIPCLRTWRYRRCPLTITMNVIKFGTYSRAATKRSVASIQVNAGTIYLLVQVDDEYRYGCPMCTGMGIW